MFILCVGRRQRHKYLALTAYDRHKILINEYLLNYPGSTELLKRDTSKDQTDLDVIKENHRFLWNNVDDNTLTWEQRMAKKYYEKVVNSGNLLDTDFRALVNNSGPYLFI